MVSVTVSVKLLVLSSSFQVTLRARRDLSIMMLSRMIIYVKLQDKRKKRNDLTNLLVGIDVCIEEVVVVCGTE
jgi:hypothetical protein